MDCSNQIGIDFKETLYICDQTARKKEGTIFGMEGEEKIILGTIEVHIFTEIPQKGYGQLLREYKGKKVFRFIVLDKIILKKEHRKKGIGLAVVNACANLATPSDVVLCYPGPMEEDREQQGKEKLQKHWAKIGFKQIEKTGVFWRKSENEEQKEKEDQ